MLTAGSQNVARPGVIELAFGEPDPALFPAAALARACAAALADGGADALPYGANAGPPGLRRLLVERIAALEGRAVDADEILISGGNSQAFDQVVTLWCDPGETVLVELPTYSLALGILGDHPVHVEGVPFDDGGLDLDGLEAKLEELGKSGRQARLLYTVPTFHNPTGVSLADDRRRRLVELAAARDLLIVEDDVYRELWFERLSPPSLWSIAPAGAVIRLGSFAKTLAPGLRVGWVTGTVGQIERIAVSGLNDSGGCVSQFAACVVERFLAAGDYDPQVELLRREYAARRDALAASLREHLPPGCSFAVPAGGFFIWLTLPEGLSATRLLPPAERHGVSFVPGANGHVDGTDTCLRLAFTLYASDELTEGARRLASAIAEAQRGV